MLTPIEVSRGRPERPAVIFFGRFTDMRALPVVLVLGCLCAAGCGGSNAPLSTPSYDPDEMAQAALTQLDKNGNGTIEGAELDACPGLKGSLDLIDTNKDKKLSLEELKARFDQYKSLGAGAVGYAVTVTLDGQPLAGATITFTPEPFMGKAVGEVTARTEANGGVNTFQVDGNPQPGLPSGVYRVSVTREGGTLPARYNTQTTLGCEVFGASRGGSTSLTLRLTSQ
jgi:hypothetical protein